MSNFPQVLLLGNGLNLAYNAGSWSDLIEKIYSNKKVPLEVVKELPFPLQAVLATDDHVNTIVENKQTEFLGIENIDELRPSLQALLSIPFDHILTTNYSYEIERVANSKVQPNGEYCKKLIRNIEAGQKAESKYMLHTYNEITYGENAHKVWHIHGEARKPESIIFGHYYYVNLLGWYQKELKSRGNKQYINQQENRPPILKSWLDAFIMGDVYVLGFGYNFSEMDMWWLLNRKKRENAIHGGLYFYEPSNDNSAKVALIEAYGGEFIDMGYQGKPIDYKLFYDEAITDIHSRVKQKKKDVSIHA